jgi:hypothetical protein
MPKASNRILDRCTFSASGGTIRRNDVANIANNEQFTWLGLSNQIRVNPGIRASNEQDSGVLPKRQLLEHLPVSAEVVGLELVYTFKQLPH